MIPAVYENEPLVILEGKLKNHFNNLEQIKEERLTEAKRLLQKVSSIYIIVFCDDMFSIDC